MKVLGIVILLLVAITSTETKRNCRDTVYAIPIPTNGRKFACCRFQKIKFVCNSGYKLAEGDEIINCTKGRIYGKFPKCVSKTSPIQQKLQKTCGAAGFRQSFGRVVGGKKAKRGDWPWMAAIYRDGSFICGGSLISPEHVVTAAHCLFDWIRLVKEPGRYKVWLGRTKRHRNENRQKQLALVDEIYMHQNFRKKSFSNDIAIIKLTKPVKMTKYVGVVCLPVKDSGIPDRTLYVTGWGSKVKHDTNQQIGKFSGALRYAAMPPVKDEDCSRRRPVGAMFDKATTLCAGAGQGQRDACFGDSGGPLVNKERIKQGKSVLEKWSIMGIVSWGDGCAKANTYGYYTRVSHYIDWIMGILKQ